MSALSLEQPSATCQVHETNIERERIHRNMLSLVSHDLKTPLATMIGSLEIYVRMSARLTDEKKEMLVDSALREAHRLDGFITNILDLAKFENEMVKINTEICDLAVVIKDCIARLGPKASLITFSVQGQSEVIRIRTDATLLCRSLGILIDNAIKYAGVSAHIEIDYGIDKDQAYLQVRDNGPGIPTDKLEEIFSKYARFATSDHQNAGTGLGLALCRLMMKLLKGTVVAQNNNQGGANFVLRFSASL